MDTSLDLFKTLTRSERQELGRQLWIKHKCCGSLVYPTGVGKTRTALNCIECILKKYPAAMETTFIRVVKVEKLNIKVD